MSPAPKFCTAATLPICAPALVDDRQADEVGVVEFLLVEIGRQRCAVDEQLGSGQRLGGAAVADPLEPHHDDGALRPDVEDFEAAAILGEERAVVAERQRIAGEGLDAQFALDAVRGADHGHQHGILGFRCGLGHLQASL